MRGLFRGLSVVWALGLCAPVLAQEEAADEAPANVGAADQPAVSQDDERARAYFMLGRSHYDAGEYEQAIEQFQRAYDLSHRTELLFNLYQAYHRARRLAPAIDHLERYLNEAEMDAERRATLDERLANLQEQLVAEQEEEARLAAEEQARLAEAREEAATDPKLTAGVVLLSIAGAGLITFGVTGGLALKEDDDLAGSCGADMGMVCTDGQVGRLQTLTRAADASIALAAAAGITGLILVIVGAGGDDDDESVAPLIGPTSVGVRGRF